mgnify:CR=1 FL=1
MYLWETPISGKSGTIDYALCRKPHNPTVTLLRGLTHTTPRTKTARRFTAKNPTKMWEIITSTVGT